MRFLNILTGLLYAAFILSIAAYADDSSKTRLPLDWKTIEVKGLFSFEAPPTLEATQKTGKNKDSYVRMFTSPTLELTFDYGFYSDSLKYSSMPHYKESVRIVDGHQAKLVTFQDPYTADLKFRYIAVIHIPDLGKSTLGETKLTMRVAYLNSSELPIAEKILESIIFKGKLPET